MLPSSMSLSALGLAFIARHEGFQSEVYRDEAGNPTIGYGHKLEPGESFPGAITREEALKLLSRDTARAEDAVRNDVTTNLTQEQFDALVSFVYNVGAENFARSSLLKDIGENNFTHAAAQFARWNKINKSGMLVETPGLTARRQAEQILFSHGIYR